VFLSGAVRRVGICSTSDRSVASQATGRSSLGAAAAIGGCERTRWTPVAPMGLTPPVIEQNSADGIVATRTSQWLGNGEGLNLKINEKLVQLNDSTSDRTEERWREIRNHHWVGGGNRPFYSERFRGTHCVDPHAACCGGWGVRYPRLPDYKNSHRTHGFREFFI